MAQHVKSYVTKKVEKYYNIGKMEYNSIVHSDTTTCDLFFVQLPMTFMQFYDSVDFSMKESFLQNIYHFHFQIGHYSGTAHVRPHIGKANV